MKISVRQMTIMAVFISLSVISIYIMRVPIIPAAPFLEYELGDVPMILCGLIYGPQSGLIVAFVASLIQSITVSASSGWIGLIMHVIATGSLIVISSIVYNKYKSIKSLIVGLLLGSLAMTLIMIPLNLIFTVCFLGVPYNVVKGMIVPAILPFNLMKSIMNSAITLVLYNQLSKVVKFKSDAKN